MFNSYGTDPSLGIDARKSVQGATGTSEGNISIPEYQIYLNDPIDICETAEAGTIELNGVTTCEGAPSYCIEYVTDKPGTIVLLLDFDGNDGIYTPGTADISDTTIIDMSQIGADQCFDWNGLDGLGNVVDDIRVLLSYEQGVYHFPIYDAEFLSEGFMIERVRPASSNVPKLFYDDSNITSPPTMGGTTGDTDLNGCTTPCHNWDNYTDGETVGFGNLNTINS